jgi:hypothetical protein
MGFHSYNENIVVYDVKKTRVLTSGKPQAATPAKYAFVPPAPYLPVSTKSRAGRFSFLQMFDKEKKMRSWPVLKFEKENSEDCC